MDECDDRIDTKGILSSIENCRRQPVTMKHSLLLDVISFRFLDVFSLSRSHRHHRIEIVLVFLLVPPYPKRGNSPPPLLGCDQKDPHH